MATTADFITTFSPQVYTAMEAVGSKLYNKVTIFDGYSGVVGSTASFPKLEKAGAPVINPTRGADLTYGSEVVHDANVSATLSVVYATEIIDDLDKLQTNANLQAYYAQALARTVGRGIDKLITDEIIANGTAYAQTGGSGKFLTIVDLYNKANSGTLPMDMRKIALNSAGWLQFFVDAPTLNFMVRWEHNINTGEIDNVMGFNAIPLFDAQSMTPAPTTNACFMWHQSALALAVGGDAVINVTLDQLPLKDSWLITAKALVAPRVLDANAVFNVTLLNP